MYNHRMKGTKEVHFSKARQQLSTIIDEVENTGTPVKIMRHGKLAAVVIGAREYRQRFEKKREWSLAGSMIAVKGVDLAKAIQRSSDRNVETRRLKLKRSAKEFAED
jgi:prevent-host-death family protein